MTIRSSTQLRELYSKPSERASKKQLNHLDKHAINFIRKSPFMTIATSDANGNLDVSPRGGQQGFVRVVDENHLFIPDYKGNNRIDSLTNIIDTGHIGTLFFIPGVDETLRVNGTAQVTASPTILEAFAEESKTPITCILITVEEVFLHCAKALMRSKLWSEQSRIDRSTLPTMGQMLKDQIGSSENPESQEDMLKRYEKDL